MSHKRNEDIQWHIGSLQSASALLTVMLVYRSRRMAASCQAFECAVLPLLAASCRSCTRVPALRSNSVPTVESRHGWVNLMV
jgi:hypothetical protein